MIYCKALDEKDYFRYGWIASAIKQLDRKLADTAHRFEHHHRLWEYSMVISALYAHECKTVLDIGGGASIFAPAYQYLYKGSSVLQIDPGVEMDWIPAQEEVMEMTLPFLAIPFEDYSEDRLFDAVSSISVIEHMEDDIAAIQRMFTYVKPGGLLALTFDFHPDGQQHVNGHLRTYDYDAVLNLIQLGKDSGFEIFGDGTDYRWRGPHVNDYTFGSLVMERKA